MKMCPECGACGGPDGVTNCETCRGDFWTRDAGSLPADVGVRRSGPTENGESGCTELRAALLEGLRISREMESEGGVMDSRVKAWRRAAHALLHPNDKGSTPSGETKP